MPHRDPQTGQFLASDHAGAYADADEVLNIDVAYGLSDANTSGEIIDNRTLTYQHDYRILAVEWFTRLMPDSPGGAILADPPGASARGTVTHQMATTGSFVEPDALDAGGAEPSGVYFEDRIGTVGSWVWEDETNGTSGATTGQMAEHYVFIPSEKMVNVDVTPDAGTSVHLRTKVNDPPGLSDVELDGVGQARLFVARRDE